MLKYEIFVSARQPELNEERKAVDDLIHEYNLLEEYFSVYRFEKEPASSEAAPKAFLKSVKKSHIYLGIFGSEYGNTDSKGISWTENEYRTALDRNKYIMLFLKKGVGVREKKLGDLIAEISKRHIYNEFSDIAGFKKVIFSSLLEYLKVKNIISGVGFESSICRKAVIRDLDQAKVQWLVKEAKKTRDVNFSHCYKPRDVIVNLNLLNKNRLTNGAILLFGKNLSKCNLHAETICLRFSGSIEKKPYRPKVFDKNIFDQIEGAYRFVLENIHNTLSRQPGSARTISRYEIPEYAIQEAIVNAISHRDYTSKANVKISIFADRIEVTNPGRLPPDVTIELLKKLRLPHPRNPLLCHVLWLADYSQKAGSGISEIINKCIEHGLPEPTFEQIEGYFRVVIWRDKYTDDFLDREGIVGRLRLAVEYVKKTGYITHVTYKKLMTDTYGTFADRTLYRDLMELVKKDVLKPIGKKKGRKYTLR